MGIRIRVGAGVIAFLLWLTPWGVREVEAEPPEACRDLAARFAVGPEQLDLKALATLGICLTTEIAERLGATGASAAPREQTPAPPLPQEGAPPPPVPQEGASPPQARQYGQWPLPAPWTESWPSPNPW